MANVVHVAKNERGGSLCSQWAAGDYVEKPLAGLYATCPECLTLEANLED